MTINFNEITIKHNKDNTHTLLVIMENSSLERKFDNIDTLWRFIGELLKGEKI